MLTIAPLQISSQIDTNAKDSICFSIPESRAIAKDLRRLDFLEGAIRTKDSTISEYVRLDSIRIDRVAEYDLEVKELTEQNNKCLKRKKRMTRFAFISGFLLGLLPLLFI